MAFYSERTASTLVFLEGSRSKMQYDADELRGTDPADGRTLLARYDLDGARSRLTKEVLASRRGGLWRWEELLPVRIRSFITTLGEGATPLLGPARLAGKLGMAGLHIKAESVNPTGSFKAPGLALARRRHDGPGRAHLGGPSGGHA